MTDISEELIERERSIYESKITSAYVYVGTPEGKLHRIESGVLRACYLRLGLLSEEENSKIVRRAELRAKKVDR